MWPAILFWMMIQQAAPKQAGTLSGAERAAVQDISTAGRCAVLAETPDERVARSPKIAPGPPPVLSFRYYEGKINHRFGNSELLLDDAGH